MPNFHFDIRDDSGHHQCRAKLRDVGAVEREAIAVAAQIVRDHGMTGRATSVLIEANDEQGRMVLKAALSFNVERHDYD